MGMLRRLREAGEALVARRLGGEAVSFAAEIPGQRAPLWQLRLEVQSEPLAGGERVRVRFHSRLALRRARAPREPGSAGGLPARVGAWVERRLESRWVRLLAAPVLDRDLHTWVELCASSAPLDEGSRALLPPRLRELGIRPDDSRRLQTWAGLLEGPRPGFAALTVGRLDRAQLPQPLQRALGDEPLSLAAAVAQIVEETPDA